MKMESLAWRLIEDGLNEGGFNMAVDRAILAACEVGQAPPTLRLYGWDRPTLTVGYAQDIAREIEVERCRELDIPVVRRPTGGRALLHQHEVTYSLIAPIPHPLFPPSLPGTHRTIAGALLAGLERMGVRGAVQAPGRKISGNGASFRSPSCLASLNHGEIEVRGAKLVGSAQRRTKRAFLQHGSVPLSLDRALLNSLFKYRPEDSPSRSVGILNRKVTTLSECLNREMFFKEVLQALKEGFRQTFSGKWVPGNLSSVEIEGCASHLHSNPTAIDQ